MAGRDLVFSDTEALCADGGEFSRDPSSPWRNASSSSVPVASSRVNLASSGGNHATRASPEEVVLAGKRMPTATFSKSICRPWTDDKITISGPSRIASAQVSPHSRLIRTSCPCASCTRSEARARVYPRRNTFEESRYFRFRIPPQIPQVMESVDQALDSALAQPRGGGDVLQPQFAGHVRKGLQHLQPLLERGDEQTLVRAFPFRGGPVGRRRSPAANSVAGRPDRALLFADPSKRISIRLPAFTTATCQYCLRPRFPEEHRSRRLGGSQPSGR